MGNKKTGSHKARFAWNAKHCTKSPAGERKSDRHATSPYDDGGKKLLVSEVRTGGKRCFKQKTNQQSQTSMRIEQMGDKLRPALLDAAKLAKDWVIAGSLQELLFLHMW